MGYDLTITRCDPEDDQCSANIGLEEWLEYVRSDREFRLDGFAEAKLSGKEVLRMEAEGLAVWIKYSAQTRKGTRRGSIISMGRYPSRIRTKKSSEDVLGSGGIAGERLR